ncbi:MAG: ATP-binding protein [Gemmatimonadales bacterium]
MNAARRAAWLVMAATVVAAEWLRQPAPWWGIVAVGLTIIGLLLARRAGLRVWLVAVATGAVASAIVLGQSHMGRVAAEWPVERERRVTEVFRRLSRELHATLLQVDNLARSALPLADADRTVAFSHLDRELPRDGPEMAVAILDPTGMPWAWAGRQRLVPEPEGDSLAARFTRFYAVLESRRRAPSGRVVVATVLVWADSAVPRPDRSLAARFGAEAGVQVEVFPPGGAPPSRDVFDYSEPTTAGDRLLFSLLPVAPEEAAVQTEVNNAAAAGVALTLVLLLAVGLVTAQASLERFLLLATLLWAVLRAPLGAAVGFDDLFSAGTFFRGSFRPFSSSAGNLLVTGSVLLILGVWLWGRRGPLPRWGAAIGVLLLLATPYLISDLGRGISPPVTGVPPDLWITWQVSLTMVTAAIVLLAGALVWRALPLTGGPGWIGVGAACGIAAAAAGLLLWEPRAGWPEWYPLLWFPALLLVARPGPRWAVLLATSIVAGSAAALVTWGAELDGRLLAAQRDLARLGDVEDPLAVPLLERLGDDAVQGIEPTAASTLYLLWRASDLGGQEFPVRLALWNRDGVRLDELALDSVDVPTSLLSALVLSLDSTQPRTVVPLLRVPGRHYVLLQHLPSGRILTVVAGPRSRLLAPGRLARLLRRPDAGPPLYEMSLSPPFESGRVRPVAAAWERSGTRLRIDRLLTLPGGNRHVYVVVGQGAFSLLLVRGALLTALDLVVLALLWWVTVLRPGSLRRSVEVRRKARSFQVRLALTLAAFFIVPAAGFTVWGLGRLTDEVDHTRDLLISAALRDAVLTAGGLLREPGDYLVQGLGELSNRLEADLLLYSGGRLIATSAPILEDLSLVEPLLDARVFQRLALGDELELTRQATTYVAPVRVGYRVAQAGPPGGVGILATPQLAYDWARTQDQRDLAAVLLLALLTGIGASFLGAQWAARALSRPVADLRRSAAAIGQGLPLPAVAMPPVEFEQVFVAFQRMAADIRNSQAALEDARQRTALVLANVATAVVALDPEGRVLLANPRAAEVLATPLVPGDALAQVLAGEWSPLLRVVEDFLGRSAPAYAVEVEVNGRTYRLQLARLGEAPGGSVLAINDLTNATQAARVLAWGEMARQVAHEIKNPLTPIRLGIQHLQRVRRDRPEQLTSLVDDTAVRILGEIDRLDTIARAFSRFGMPGGEAVPLARLDLEPVAREVAGLYGLTAEGVEVVVEVATGGVPPQLARQDEVKEVLGNLVENARSAEARRIVIRLRPDGFDVEDDGTGIPAALLPRIFEPRFSTTTSGAGLGLPIVRRLVESWGATVVVESGTGRGSVVQVRWP